MVPQLTSSGKGRMPRLMFTRLSQRPLFCGVCGAVPAIQGMCLACYRQHRHSMRYFAGHRETVLIRDSFRCQGCGTANQRAVHHRRPGVSDAAFLITLCPACHAVIHKLSAHRRWLPEPLLGLWREQHPGVPLQLQLENAHGREISHEEENTKVAFSSGRPAGGRNRKTPVPAAP